MEPERKSQEEVTAATDAACASAEENVRASQIVRKAARDVRKKIRDARSASGEHAILPLPSDGTGPFPAQR
jgi:hypothetical protein